jgi:formylglycine-generating enzyme required for sulfatase activity
MTWQTELGGEDRMQLRALPFALMLVLAPAASAQAADPATALADGANFRDCAECPEMTIISAGTFSTGGALRGEVSDFKRVTLSRRFALARSEVTRGEFAAFLAATSHRPTDKCLATLYQNRKWATAWEHAWNNPGFMQNDSHPVVCVSWTDANAYARWLSERTGRRYRLPSDGEWEFAARRHYEDGLGLWPWTDVRTACKFANLHADTLAPDGRQEASYRSPYRCDDGAFFTAPVNSFQPSPSGLFDMTGNAAEWTCTSLTGDGPANDVAYEPEACKPPKWEPVDWRAWRGGSWYDGDQTDISFISRKGGDIGEGRNVVGFRLAREID